MEYIVKRDGRIVPYAADAIASAMYEAFKSSKEVNDKGYDIQDMCRSYAADIEKIIDSKYASPIYIEFIQNEVEMLLMLHHPETAKAYILYRNERYRIRDKQSRLMKTLDDIARSDAKDCDIKRENANIDGNTAMGTMLKFGSESAKAYYDSNILTPIMSTSHNNGDIHIHDLDFLTLTMTCCQIDLIKLFYSGFSTGHGYLREPKSIRSYSALAAIALQANQNDMHGGQSIPNFDRSMAPGVAITFASAYKDRLTAALELISDCAGQTDFVKQVLSDVKNGYGEVPSLSNSSNYDTMVSGTLLTYTSLSKGECDRIVAAARRHAMIDAEKQTHQAMEALIHNLNTMHSRAGAQVPFSTINYGTDTSPEGRMIIKNILLSTLDGLGKGETPIFPIQIFRLKHGINFDKGDPNYDLFQLACQVSAKRLFPNFSFQDAPFNLKYYNPLRPETEIAYMGCRTRIMSNVYAPEQEISYGRGNLSFTTINLPRLAILSNGDKTLFFNLLKEKLELVAEQLMERYQIQASKKVKNFPFLMGQGVWLGSENLGSEDSVAEIIKHGTLSIGFIGLAECLSSLNGKHHGECEEAQKLGLEIIGEMRNFCDRKAEEKNLNFTLLATPAEGLSGRFVKLDRKRYGSIPGVTDKAYYTNSFHIPVGYEISVYDKIRLEAPYHSLTNAGHITYIELDGDASKNHEAIEAIIKCMGEFGIGYGAINHPIDRDPICGYSGIINNECPQCGRIDSDGKVHFERIRRITGYLVGTIERFNDAKRSEEQDRVKHASDDNILSKL